MEYVIDNVFDRYMDPETLSRIVDYTDMTQMWRSCCRQYSDLPAIDDGRVYSYGELDMGTVRQPASAAISAAERMICVVFMSLLYHTFRSHF